MANFTLTWLVSSNIPPELLVLIACLMPGVEARYALVLGVSLGLSLPEALILSLAGLASLVAVLVLVIRWLDRTLPGIPLLGKLYIRVRESSRRRAGPYIERWGYLGLALFVMIPLPATGVYTGALAALLLGLRGTRLVLSLLAGGAASIAVMLPLAGIIS